MTLTFSHLVRDVAEASGPRMQQVVQRLEVVLGSEAVALPLRVRGQVRSLGKQDQLEVGREVALLLDARVVIQHPLQDDLVQLPVSVDVQASGHLHRPTCQSPYKTVNPRELLTQL